MCIEAQNNLDSLNESVKIPPVFDNFEKLEKRKKRRCRIVFNVGKQLTRSFANTAEHLLLLGRFLDLL